MLHHHLAQSQEHKPLLAPHNGHPQLLPCVMAEVIFPEHLCELVASGASRETESRKVRGMERGTESGKEE